MADIFISYANGDRELAAALAGKLTSRGYTVWWDHRLVGGAQFRDVIHKELQEARAVIVLWSKSSVDSAWVKDEADEAMRLGKLIPLRAPEVAPSSIPLGHRGTHMLPLSDFETVLRTVRSELGGNRKLTADVAIRKSGLAMAETTTLAWRYSYEYGLHIAICFILTPIVIDIMGRMPAAFMNSLPKFDIWVQLAIFFGCLGWSSLISTLARRRYDSGIFLTIMVLMLLTLLVYLFTPSGEAWAFYQRNFLIGIRAFLLVGTLLWVIFLWRRLRLGLALE